VVPILGALSLTIAVPQWGFHLNLYTFGREGEERRREQKSAGERFAHHCIIIQLNIDFIILIALKGRLGQRNLDVDLSWR
jgi:hypothetical protein